MEITEDRIDELILKAQNWEEHDQLGAFAKEVIAIVERQREEIAALQGVINDIERAVINETVNPPKLQSWIVHRIHAPAPEPATVEADTDVYKYHAYLVEATAANAKPLTLSQWLQFHGNTAAPVETAPAPEPAPEIKVGDSVRITQLPSALHGRAGTVVQITGQLPVYTVRVWGGNTLDFMRDQIERV